MAVNASNVVIGPCTITVSDADLGLTSESGITFSEETRDYYDVFSDQAMFPVRTSLVRVSRTISCEMQEVTIANMKIALGASALTNGGKITYTAAPTEYTVVITGPAANSLTFTYTTTCWSISCGDIVRQKSGEALLPVTFREKGDPTYNTFGTWSEAGA